MSTAEQILQEVLAAFDLFDCGFLSLGGSGGLIFIFCHHCTSFPQPYFVSL